MASKTEPVISIITPVWNGMPFLRECVESVLKQDFQDWELIISDNGSMDDSRSYIATLKDPRIRFFYQKENLGIFGNLNFLFRQARAPISQILCHDDFFVSLHSLRRIVDYWGGVDSAVGYACFNQSLLPERGYVGFFKRHQPRQITSSASDLWYYVFGCMPGNLSNVTLRTAIVSNCGWFREDLPYVGDFEFWARAARRFNFHFVPDVVTHVRAHAGQASSHLNQRGEYVWQEGAVVGELFRRLQEERVAPELLLRLHATIRYHARQLEIGLRRWWQGNSAYLCEVQVVSQTLEYRMNRVVSWIFFILSLGGRFGPNITGRYLLDLTV
ncbi:MAG: glycosyltransferase [Candidatus Nitrotoga sp.]